MNNGESSDIDVPVCDAITWSSGGIIDEETWGSVEGAWVDSQHRQVSTARGKEFASVLLREMR